MHAQFAHSSIVWSARQELPADSPVIGEDCGGYGPRPVAAMRGETGHAYPAAPARLPVLSREQEQAYAHRVQAGDQPARTALILHNLGLVISIANKYRRSGSLHAELVAAGNLALIRAVEKFDPAFDRRFSTYATWWIRAAMERTLEHYASVVSMPRQLMLQRRRVQRLAARQQQAALEQIHLAGGDEAGIWCCSMTLDALAAVSSEQGCYASPCRELGRLRLQEKLDEWIRCLPPMQTRVLQLYFGLAGEDKHTLLDCAAQLQLSRQQVIQLRNRALTALRTALCRHGLDRATVLSDD